MDDEVIDDEIMDTRPLLSFDNFVNNRPSSGTGSYMAKYIGKVTLGSFPKILIIVFSVIIIAYTTEITSGHTNSDKAAFLICYDNPRARHSDHRICHSLMAEAIASILISMMLMNFDVFIPCINKMFKKLAHCFSLLVSIIMCIMLLVTSILTIRLYTIYCHHLRSIDHYDYNNGKYPRNCGHNESSFLILPMFGFFIMVVWGLNGFISLVRLQRSQ